jgi:hypothetical protein
MSSQSLAAENAFHPAVNGKAVKYTTPRPVANFAALQRGPSLEWLP